MQASGWVGGARVGAPPAMTCTLSSSRKLQPRRSRYSFRQRSVLIALVSSPSTRLVFQSICSTMAICARGSHQHPQGPARPASTCLRERCGVQLVKDGSAASSGVPGQPGSESWSQASCHAAADHLLARSAWCTAAGCSNVCHARWRARTHSRCARAAAGPDMGQLCGQVKAAQGAWAGCVQTCLEGIHAGALPGGGNATTVPATLQRGQLQGHGPPAAQSGAGAGGSR